MLSIYLAGPDVFLANAADVFKRKKALCADHGFKGNSPFDNDVIQRPGETSIDFSRRIFDANVALIHESDFGVFDLTPFRSPSADAGTIFELGLMTGLKKPVFGYTNIVTDLADRVTPKQPNPSGSGWLDENGWTVEDFGNADNLMIDSALFRFGAQIVRLGPPLIQRFEDLEGFTACLVQARQFFAALPSKPS